MAEPEPEPDSEPSEAERARLAGNRRFKAREYDAAAELYSEALRLLGEGGRGGPGAEGVVLANRAAAHLAARRFQACLDDCVAAGACSSLDPGVVRKLGQRQAKAEANRARAATLAQEAAAAVAERRWGAAIAATEAALDAHDRGAAADPARAALLCDQAEALAAIGDFRRAFSSASLSVSTAPTARAHTILARLTTFLESRDEGPEGAGGVVETGLAPGASRLTSVVVTPSCTVTLREVYISTTGGRLWHAALLLAHHLLSASGAPAVLAECRAQRGRILEVGAGLGLVGLALVRYPDCALTWQEDCRL